VIFATPTWMGQPGSVIKGALERLDALLSETQEDGTPMAFNKVAGFVVTGNEDGAHACIAAMAHALVGAAAALAATPIGKPPNA